MLCGLRETTVWLFVQNGSHFPELPLGTSRVPSRLLIWGAGEPVRASAKEGYVPTEYRPCAPQRHCRDGTQLAWGHLLNKDLTPSNA